MSNPFVKASHKVLFNNDLNPLERLVLVSLGYWDRGNGRGCFAKRTTMAKMMGISTHLLRKSLDNLEEKGLVEINRRKLGRTDVIRIVQQDTPTEINEVEPIHYKEEKITEVDVVSTPEGDFAEETSRCAHQPLTVSKPKTDENTKPLTQDDYRRLQTMLGVKRMELYFNDASKLVDEEKFINFVFSSEVCRGFVCDIFGDDIREVFNEQVYFPWR